MTQKRVERDERTVAVENASYRWAYLGLSYGLLLAAAYRSFWLGQSAWDLLALVILGGAVATIRQGGEGVLSRRWLVATVLAMLCAAVLAAAAVMLMRANRG